MTGGGQLPLPLVWSVEGFDLGSDGLKWLICPQCGAPRMLRAREAEIRCGVCQILLLETVAFL